MALAKNLEYIHEKQEMTNCCFLLQDFYNLCNYIKVEEWQICNPPIEILPDLSGFMGCSIDDFLL